MARISCLHLAQAFAEACVAPYEFAAAPGQTWCCGKKCLGNYVMAAGDGEPFQTALENCQRAAREDAGLEVQRPIYQ